MAVLLETCPVFAQTPASLPPAPPAVTTFFPLSEVHRGLQGVAYTVFEGTKPEPMGVEILGVLHNARGPRQDMILARLEGKKAEYTGVVAGMSGSPVYIDGKLLGALAFRIGQFSKEPIAGITPIGEMLQVRDTAPSAENDTELAQSGIQNGTENSGTPGAQEEPVAVSAGGASRTVPDSPLIQPMETPLVFSGFSPEAVQLWKQHAPVAGLMPVAGIGGSSSDEKQPDPVVPGSAVSAVIVRGDLDISATCTVTYVDPKQLLACGHPITQFGPVNMPMTKADVVATLASPLNAFKIINTTETVGSFTEDRESAIKGVFGRTARMIPVTLRITGDQNRSLHFEVIDQPQITPMALMVSVFQGLMGQNSYSAETTYRLQGTVKLAGYPSLKLNNLLAPTDLLPANLQAALALGEGFTKLYDNAARRTPIESVDIEVKAIPRRLTAQMESAQVSASELHAGDTVTVEATIRPWRGEPHNVRIPVKLPATLPDGQVRLLVSDGATLDRLLQPPQFGGQPLDVEATIAQLNSAHPGDRLYVTLLTPDAQASVDGRTLTALPLSMANVLSPLQDNHGMTLHGESAMPVASVPLDAVLSGYQVLTLQVE
ncbi:SpoIVB peptidase S55 domain-containing protein [Paracidobacterium acidisoli]|nr:SpoIVB peptidase S55 domain-containing protein [Paracidobacterium acidisoli]MBT9330765.1 SpoIVB peptidase S55 [Paracidobacterium acidisoli]